MGPQKGKSGKTARPYAAWCLQRRQVQEALVGVECSDKFKPDILTDALGDLYVLAPSIVDPEDSSVTMCESLLIFS